MTIEEINKKAEELTLTAQTMDGALRLVAEECAEVIQASLKYIRSESCSYIDKDKVFNNLAEEIGDVESAMIGLKALLSAENLEFNELVRSIRESKVKRWESRIEAEKGNTTLDK